MTGFTNAGYYIQTIVDACDDSLTTAGIEDVFEHPWTASVTHLVYLREGGIQVAEIAEMKERGVECGQDGIL